MIAPLDRLGRRLVDARISVTDRCNFRCGYCMPRAAFAAGHAFLARERLMTPAEIGRLASILVRLGVEKVRLTGGEPLLRRELAEIVAAVRTAGVADLALTTNGSLLAGQAATLRAAGLHRLTVSLDTLDAAIHARISDSRVPLATVLAGIEAARAAGFSPLKLNAVVRRGVNEDAVLPLVEYARAHGDTVRFIEYMDVGTSNGWDAADVVPAAEVLAIVDARHPLEPVGGVASAVARRHRFLDGGGEIGIISSVTEPFCATCTRLRVSADGRLHTCLFAVASVDLLDPLRAGDDIAVEELLRATWRDRADRYSEQRAMLRPLRRRPEMSYIGG